MTRFRQQKPLDYVLHVRPVFWFANWDKCFKLTQNLTTWDTSVQKGSTRFFCHTIVCYLVQSLKDLNYIPPTTRNHYIILKLLIQTTIQMNLDYYAQKTYTPETLGEYLCSWNFTTIFSSPPPTISWKKKTTHHTIQKGMCILTQKFTAKY